MAKMKAAIVHNSLNSFGGGERVCVSLIELLRQLGYEVTLITADKTDFSKMQNIYGRKVNVDREVVLLPLFRLPFFGIYQRILTLIPAMFAKSDLIINTHGDILPYYYNGTGRMITYCHFPTMALYYRHGYPSKYHSGLWKWYFTPYIKLLKKLSERAVYKGTLLTNSHFSEQAILDIYPTAKPRVIYPCADVERFATCVSSDLRRENRVLVIGRFTPEKNFEQAIKMAARIKGVKLTIIGSLIPYNMLYFESLKRLAKDLSISDSVEFLPSAPLTTVMDRLKRSKVILNCFRGEHFGISTVEGMAAGLIPVVSDYGGATEFVPKEYQYTDFEKMCDCITYAIDKGDDERLRMFEIAQRFDDSHFKEAMKKVIQESELYA